MSRTGHLRTSLLQRTCLRKVFGGVDGLQEKPGYLERFGIWNEKIWKPVQMLPHLKLKRDEEASSILPCPGSICCLSRFLTQLASSMEQQLQ